MRIAFALALIALAAHAQVRQSEQTFRSSGRAVRCEIFVPANARKAPAVLLLHGGAGMTVRAADFRRYAHDLAAHGYVAFLPYYFDATDPTDAWKRTLKFLDKYLRAD